MYRHLPKPDDFGNYWLGDRKGANAGPAIMPSKRLKGDDVKATGTYLIFLGPELGFLCQDGVLVRVRQPREALDIMNEQLEGEVAK